MSAPRWITRLFGRRTRPAPVTRRRPRLAVEHLEDRSVPTAAGSLDSAFGASGLQFVDFGAGQAVLNDLALQPDGKIIAAGTAGVGTTAARFALARLNADGSLDATFGTSGVVAVNTSNSAEDLRGVAVQADGKIIAVGSANGGATMRLVRYTDLGAVDATLDIDVLPGDERANDVAIDPVSGQIVIAGSAAPAAGGSQSFFAVVRLRPDLTFDPTFDTDGRATTSFGTEDAAALAVLIQPDGKVVAVGHSSTRSGVNTGVALARYLDTGAPDTGFGSGGTVLTSAGSQFTDEDARAAALQPDGSILVTGQATNTVSLDGNLILFRYRPNGALDNFFGASGKTLLDLPGTFTPGNAVAVAADGKILVAGAQRVSGDVSMVARFTTAGALDSTFGSSGVAQVDAAANGDDGFNAMLLQPNGSIVAGGRTNAALDMSVARILARANERPVARPDSYTTLANTPKDLPLTANDTDPDRDALSVIVVTQPQHGTLTPAGPGTLRYTPAANYVGPDAFTYRLSDGLQPSNDVNVTISVQRTNVGPTGVDDNFVTNEDVPLIIKASGVLGNDTDPEQDPLRVTSFTQPVNGSLVIAGDGLLVYTPRPNFSGQDVFTYTLADDRGAGSSATVSITVNPVNDPPAPVADAFTLDEDGSLVVDPLANDLTGPEPGEQLALQSFTQALRGTVTQEQDGRLKYTPNLNHFGYDVFYYTVNDGRGGVTESAVTFSVKPVNDAPVHFLPAAAPKVFRNGTLKFTGANRVAVTDVDSGKGRLTTTLQVTRGSLRLGSTRGLVAATGNGGSFLTLVGTRVAINTALLTLTYNPARNATGVVKLFVNSSDNGGAGSGGAKRDSDTVLISVGNRAPVADAAAAANKVYTVSSFGTLNVSVAEGLAQFFRDPDGDPVVVRVVDQPTSGTVSVLANGSFSYTPATGVLGRVTFTVKGTDLVLFSDIITINIDVVA